MCLWHQLLLCWSLLKLEIGGLNAVQIIHYYFWLYPHFCISAVYSSTNWSILLVKCRLLAFDVTCGWCMFWYMLYYLSCERSCLLYHVSFHESFNVGFDVCVSGSAPTHGRWSSAGDRVRRQGHLCITLWSWTRNLDDSGQDQQRGSTSSRDLSGQFL